ncbi:tyrosine-type recombinase/integrase [Saccharothrix sp. Mg75]|uniref:tyrosine-type recombinase/integrase n=1 Tax=Saccharothrix sp. Mg75 TaxID=3445357 RepID=UPI003EEB042D
MSGDIEMAAALLGKLGVSPEQLIGRGSRRSPLPTFVEFVPRVAGAVPDGTRKLYSTYWNKMLGVWADRRIDEIDPTDVNWLIEHTKATVVQRRSGRGGHSAAEHAFEALRCLYRHAVSNRLMDPWDVPTEHVRKPKRVKSNRRSLDVGLVEEIVEVASLTGNDPKLDSLLLRFHIETAARRGGALALRLRDLDPVQCLVQLREKGNVHRWQPVSPTLMSHLQRHARTRGARDPESAVFRYLDGKPLTDRRYDHLWSRLGEHIESVRTQGITMHWLRHTTLTWVERSFGYAVARAYAGHATASTNRYGVTATYVRASVQEVAEALSALTGEAHPLAPQGEDRGKSSAAG